MHHPQNNRRILAWTALSFTYLLGTAPTWAEETKPTVEKWRPRSGTYAEPGADFTARCGEFGDTRIDWSNNVISGGEEGCKIVKLTDTAPGAIRLDVACTDIEREKPYKEIILLKKIDDKTISLRESENGKFSRLGGPMSYCPDDTQRMYIESQKKGS